ncbi:hypothetical protein UMM65_06755 [Aureibaculum sp. 2210JD6-5]|uniref:hypothetical protein n=1 Tax=Aureibaculum sp. 2210JD6-5 TaxID=3103957 RepID=UPI002AAE0D01|nr:hypothetical protein [Aureibaculum sp. 2210JD6-5]MDY7394934.1 hypothetical protein [Aureibaculum sp. 2210JD6-5]
MNRKVAVLLGILLLNVNAYTQILQEGFENPLTGWTQYQVTGSIPFSRTTAQANTGSYSEFTYTPNAIGFFGTTNNQVWLISPSLNLSSAEDIELSYFQRNRTRPGSAPLNPTQQVLYSTNYSGSGNPNAATWTVINSANATNSWTKTTISGQIPTNSNVYIAFRYVGDSFNFFIPFTDREWYIDNIEILSLPCSYTTTWNGSSWSNGVPNANTSAIINGNYNTNTNGSFESCNLTVNSGRTVNIRPNTHITVNNNLTVNGTVQVRNRGSLLMTDDDAQISVNGTFRVHKTTTTLNDNNDYTYWSSPVENINISSVFASPNYNQGRLYYWDQSAVNAIPYGGSEALGEWIPAAGLTMQAGKGYISQGPTTGTYPLNARVRFTGKPNNGEIELTGNSAVYNPGNPNDDLNLVGNPYPSAIDADEFISQNSTDISGTLWFWTHTTPNNGSTSGEQYTNDDYAAYNLTGGTSSAPSAGANGVTPNQFIASGQGFMVETLPTVSSIKFNNSMRVENNNNQFFRGIDTKKSAPLEKDRIWLNVESNNGGAFSQILVGFFENATDGVDQGYDGKKISEGWINLYSAIDSLKYAIQGLSSFSSDKKVALGFQTYIDDPSILYSISIDKFEGQLKNSDIFLVDNVLNITHDLKQGNYNFTVAEAGNYPNRFTLQFTQATLTTEDIKTNNQFSVINNENAVNIKANNTIDFVKIYDITGRLLIEKNVNNSDVNINTQSLIKGSVLIVNTFFEDNSSLSKKIILTK